jgi:hypothetical protein
MPRGTKEPKEPEHNRLVLGDLGGNGGVIGMLA